MSQQTIPVPIATPLQLGYGGTISHDLGISPKTVQAPSPGWQYVTEGVYTLKFTVKNGLTTYPGAYDVEIDFGTQKLGEAYGWSTSTPSQITVTFPSPGYLILDKALPGGGPVQGAQNLVIHFTVNDGSANGGWPVIFDQVSLTFTSN